MLRKPIATSVACNTLSGYPVAHCSTRIALGKSCLRIGCVLCMSRKHCWLLQGTQPTLLLVLFAGVAPVGYWWGGRDLAVCRSAEQAGGGNQACAATHPSQHYADHSGADGSWTAADMSQPACWWAIAGAGTAPACCWQPRGLWVRPRAGTEQVVCTAAVATVLIWSAQHAVPWVLPCSAQQFGLVQ